MNESDVILWFQFAYAMWQFVRVAKFFRLPWAVTYHTWLWMVSRRDQFRNVKPFSTQMILLVFQGRPWLYPGRSVEDYLRYGEYLPLNEGHFLQERQGIKHVVSCDDIPNCNVLDRQVKHASKGCPLLICSHVDLIVPTFFIADIYDWSEGFEKFLEKGSVFRMNGKVLLVSNREYFLNQNLVRFLSILPLMLQAKGLNTLSVYVSAGIIFLDMLGYPVNLAWKKLNDVLVNLGKLLISRIREVKQRQFVSTFLSSMTPRLKFTDELVRNFYYVEKDEEVLLFGTSCAEFLDLLGSPEEPDLKSFVTLSEEDYHSLDTLSRTKKKVSVSELYDIHVGDQYVEHCVGEGRIMTFFKPQKFVYHSFLDFDCLNAGNMEANQEANIKKALKWIEDNKKLPVTCNHKGQLRAVAFHYFVDKVAATGYGALRARVKKASWV